MASPLDLILGATEPLGQLAAAYEANQSVSGAKAQLLDYLYKSVNSGAMTPQEAQVMYQAEQKGIVPTPRMEPAVPVQPQPATGLSAKPGTAVNAIAAAPPAPAPTFAAPPPPAPTAAPGLGAAPVPAPAPAAQPAAAVAPQVNVPTGVGLDVPPQKTAANVPPSARDAQPALGIGVPTFDVAQAQMDPTAYQQARDAVAASLRRDRPPLPLKLDISQVKNREFDTVSAMLTDIMKTRDSGKQALKLAELQAAITRDELKARGRTNLANMDAMNKARFKAAEFAQEGNIEAAKLMQKYAAVMQQVQSREFIARLNTDPQYLDAMIRLIGQLESSEAQVIASGMGVTAAGQADIQDLQNTKNLLMPLLQQLVQQAQSNQNRGGGTTGTVTGSTTTTKAPAGQPAPAPAQAGTTPPPQTGTTKQPLQQSATPAPKPKPPKPPKPPQQVAAPEPMPPNLSPIQQKIWQAQQKKKKSTK